MGILYLRLNLLSANFISGILSILLALALFPTNLCAQPVSSIDIVVPRKAPPLSQIAQMELTVQADTTAPIGFTLTPPTGSSDNTPDMSPGDPTIPSSTMIFGSDLVRFYPPDATLDPADPRRRNYRIIISPNSDFDANSCETQMASDETWNLAVTGGATRIVNTCLVSEDENTTSHPVCDGFYRIVPSSEAVSEIGGLASQEQSCRFGVEAMLVLDRSGSMGGVARPAEAASPTNQKIVSLRNAVTAFTTALSDVRATETANGLTVPTDSLGVVIFNHDSETLPGLAAGLNNFDIALPGSIDTQLAAVGPSGSTSIGDGLIEAANSLGGAEGNVRRVILLMSDGKQNTNQRVSVIDNEIVTHAGSTACPSGSGSPGCELLPNNGNFSVCAVTVGTSSAVDPSINQAVALAGNCFYLNSEDDASEMSNFFLNVLQNFVATGSWQTLVAGSGVAGSQESGSFSVPVTSTTQALSVTLVPPAGSSLCLSVSAPGQPPSDQVCGRDVVSFRKAASEMTSGDMGGEWKISVQLPVVTVSHADAASHEQGNAPFYLMVLADDVGIHAKAEVLATEFAPLVPIRVRVRLDEHGESLTGLSSSGLTLGLASPSRTLGELMAGATANTSGSEAVDSSSVDAAVDNAVLADTTILLDQDSEIPLVESDPGLYEAQFSVQKYGHTDLLMTLRGQAPHGGSFIRQIRKTIFIKALPDQNETEVTTKVIRGRDGNSLAIQLKPKTKGGLPIGPGWKNYYWLKGPGVKPFKLADNLDGTYSGSIGFSGVVPPSLSVHFIPDTVSISDDVTATELPSALDSSTVLIPQIMGDKGDQGGGTIPLWLVLLLILVLALLAAVYFLRHRSAT